MLDSNIQTLAEDHANALASKGVYVSARPGTPIADMVAYCSANAVNSGLSTSDDFDALTSGLADTLADYTRGYLDFARNVAKPALTELQTAVTEALKKTDSAAVYNPFAGMDIIQVGAPEILENSDFLQSVSHYNSGSEQVKNIAPHYGPRTTEQLIEMCATGNSVWDAQIKAWLDSLPEDKIQSAWQSVFMDKITNTPTAPIISLETLLKDYTQGGFSALIVFLLANRIQSSIDDEFGHNLEVARQFLYSLLQACATCIERGINWFNSFVTTNSLVANMDRQKRKITVNSAVFKRFLSEGGKADVLMGMIVSNRTYNTIDEIKANAESLLQAFNDYSLSTTSLANAAFDTHLRSLMRQCFEDSLSKPVNDVETEQIAAPGAKETMMRRFSELLDGYTAEQLRENNQEALWRCACQARYYYSTTTYDLLDAIDHGVRIEERDPRDAATLAVQKIVPKFLAEMLKT